MAWYLNRALTNFRNEVNTRWPRRDKTSDGTIGDLAHQNTSSDHNPDYDGSVDAWDMDIDGVDLWEIIDAALRHESIQYIIYNRKVTSRSWGLGSWRNYDGSNPHDKHVHFNTRESHEDSTRPWLPEENKLPYTETQMKAFPWQYDGKGMPGVPAEKSTLWVLGTIYTYCRDIFTAIGRIETKVNVLSVAQTPVISVSAADVAAALRDDVIFRTALAEAVADELAARLAD